MGVKLGQKWAVKDGNLLASNQVGSRFFNKEFDFSRASNGTYVDKNGVLQTAELYNLLPYGSDFTQWVSNNTSETIGQLGYDGTNNAYLLDITGGTSSQRIELDYTLSGEQTLSFYAKANTLKWARITNLGGSAKVAYYDLENGVVGSSTAIDANIQGVGNGWYRCSMVINESATRFRIYPATDNNDVSQSSGSIYIQDAQVVEGTEPLDYQYTNGLQGLPRISFEDGVGHLLLEPQRSNLLLQSNQFDTTWLKTYTSVTGGQSGIYGTNDAWKLSEIAANSVHILVQNTSSVSSYTYSVYLKKGTRNKVLLFDGTNNVGVKFNLETQSFNSFYSTTIDYNIEVLSDEWARYSISPSNTSSSFRIYMLDDNYNLAYEGNTSNYIYIQHAQLEPGSYPTSVIETTTTQITRLADVCNNSGSAQDFNSEEGVLYAEAAGLSLDTVRFSISDGTNNNNIYIELNSGLIAAVGRSGGVNQFALNSSEDILSFNKIAVKYKENDFALWVNGVEVDTDTSGITPTAISSLQFDRGDSFIDFYGKVRNVQAFTEALGDTELMTLTGGDGSLNGLFTAYKSRVETDGGYLEAETCLINELKELL